MAEVAVGGLLDETEMVVERGQVRAFARALGERTEDPAALPTFLAAALLWREEPQEEAYRRAGLELGRLMHGEVAWEWSRPLRLGEVLTVRRRLASRERKRGRRGGAMTLVTIEAVFLDRDGEEVARQRDVVIEVDGD